MRKTWKMGLAGSTAAAALAMCAPAAAQDSPGGRPAATAVESVVVTARRRQEALEQVPVAGNVLTSEQVENLVLDNIADYVKQVPAATLITSGPEAVSDISIRGQGVGRLGFTESATGIYRNGIFIAGGGFGGRAFNRMDFFDLERFEAFRGPQGALYGRNAVGGSVNIVTRKPQPRFDARSKVGFEGEVAGAEVENVLNVPLSDAWLTRFGMFARGRDGGFIEEAPSGRALDERQQLGARAAVRRLTSDSDLTLTLERYQSRSPSYDIVGYSPDSGDPGPYRRANLTTYGAVFIQETSGFLEYDRDLGFAQLGVVANIKERDGKRFDDLDHFLGLGATGADIRTFIAEEFSRWGVEARLSSNSEGPLGWLIGADYQQNEAPVRRLSWVVRNPFATGQRRTIVNNQAENTTVQDELTSYSLFGSITYALSDRLELAVEGRVQHDEKTQIGVDRQPGATVASYRRTAEFTEVTPGVTLTFEAFPEQYAYARFATGYRPGGFNESFLFLGLNTPGVSYDPEYARSYEVGFKGSLFDRRIRFEAAAFAQNTTDVQLVTRDPTSGVTASALLNAGESWIYGAEIDIRSRFQAAGGTVTLNFGLSGTNGEFADGSGVITRTGFLDLSGARVARTRDYILSWNTTYEREIPGTELSWSATLSVQAEGGGYENLAGGAKDANGQELENFETVDLRWALIGDRWRFSIYGKNILDEIYKTQSLANATGNAAFPGTGFTEFYGEPRMWGVDLTFRY